jgi:hypothetical protein
MRSDVAIRGEAIDQAKGEGWTFDDKKAYCPHCSQRRAEWAAKDAARQRHAEVPAHVAQRLKAAQDEQEKGYGTSV